MLGLALPAIAVGALAAMNLTGGIADRFGSRLPLIVGLFGSSAAFVLLGWASNVGYLTVVFALGCYGMMVGMVDVTMNLEGAAAERASGKSIFASFHGMHSVGGMVGAGCGALAAGNAIGVTTHFAGMGGITAIVSLATWLLIRPVKGDPMGQSTEQAREKYTVPTRASIVALGVLAFCILLAEGAVNDWSAVLLVEHQGVSAASAGLAFGAFSLFKAARAKTRIKTNLWAKMQTYLQDIEVPDWETLWRLIAKLGPKLVIIADAPGSE